MKAWEGKIIEDCSKESFLQEVPYVLGLEGYAQGERKGLSIQSSDEI